MATVSDCGYVSTPHKSVIKPCAADHCHFQDTSPFTSPELSSSPSRQSSTSDNPWPPDSSPHSLRDRHPDLQRVIDWVKSPSFATPDWAEFRLELQLFEELQESESDWSSFGKNVKYDYSCTNQILSLRMPISRGHESLVLGLTGKIRDRLAKQDNDINSSTIEFTQRILELGSTTIDYRSDKGENLERDPDAQFGFEGRPKPTLICEVAWSQSDKDLAKLALEYIRCTHGEIRTVVGLDVDYAQWKSASVTVWRAVLNEKEELMDVSSEPTVIRSKEGAENSDPKDGLRLWLKDFASHEELKHFPAPELVPIFISVKELCAMLDQAENGNGVWKAAREKSRQQAAHPPASQNSSRRHSLRSRKARGS